MGQDGPRSISAFWSQALNCGSLCGFPAGLILDKLHKLADWTWRVKTRMIYYFCFWAQTCQRKGKLLTWTELFIISHKKATHRRVFVYHNLSLPCFAGDGLFWARAVLRRDQSWEGPTFSLVTVRAWMWRDGGTWWFRLCGWGILRHWPIYCDWDEIEGLLSVREGSGGFGSGVLGSSTRWMSGGSGSARVTGLLPGSRSPGFHWPRLQGWH